MRYSVNAVGSGAGRICGAEAFAPHALPGRTGGLPEYSVTGVRVDTVHPGGASALRHTRYPMETCGLPIDSNARVRGTSHTVAGAGIAPHARLEGSRATVLFFDHKPTVPTPAGATE